MWGLVWLFWPLFLFLNYVMTLWHYRLRSLKKISFMIFCFILRYGRYCYILMVSKMSFFKILRTAGVIILTYSGIILLVGYMAFLPLAKKHPLSFWQFGFITVNFTKLWLPTVIFTVLCQNYTWLFEVSDKNTTIALSYSQFHDKNISTFLLLIQRMCFSSGTNGSTSTCSVQVLGYPKRFYRLANFVTWFSWVLLFRDGSSFNLSNVFVI